MGRQRRLAVRTSSLLLAVLVIPIVARAESRGMQLTPDARRVLVNKDVGSERWTITQNQEDGTVTGNVFRAGGGPPAFIFCEPNGDALRCFGADACSGAFGQRGIQGTPDGKRILVNKDVGTERWAITLNQDGTVTGNVFRSDGGPPAFLYCQSTGGNAFRCFGADACTTSPCTNGFNFLADVTLPASFFALPVPCNAGYVLLSADVRLPGGFFLPPNDTRAVTENLSSNVVDATKAVLDVGVALINGGTSSLETGTLMSSEASTVFFCSQGGLFTDDGSTIQAFDCGEAGLILNGVAQYTFDIFTGELVLGFQQVLIFDARTGEQSFWSGTLSFLADGPFIFTNGAVGVSSSFLGTYVVTFFDYTTDGTGTAVAGAFQVDVQQGRGSFAGVHALRFESLGRGVDRVEIDFLNGATQVFIFAFTLCDPCISNATCADGLGCFFCNTQCTGGTPRCSLLDDFVQCVDGAF